MSRIGQDDLRPVLEQMVERAAAGEIVVITRDRIAVAQLAPAYSTFDAENAT